MKRTSRSMTAPMSTEQQLREMNEALLVSSIHQHELTEQAQQAEAAVRDSERRFRELIDALPAAVYTTDAQGRLTHFNPACVELSGRTPTLGSDHWCITWKLYYPDGRPMSHDECPMAIALKKGRTIRGAEAIAERPDGTRIWFATYPTPLRDECGKIIAGVNMLVDITERKQAEEALRESEQRFRHAADQAEAANLAKDMFLATLSHEMRTPLSAIVGWMQILQGGTAGGCSDAELNEGLEVIERNARSMVQLMDDVLDVSRIVSGKVRLEVQPCDLSKVIRAGIDVVRSAAQAKDITLSAELDPAASAMSCDAVRMQQVVWNLVSNAVKFTPKGGTVRVTLARLQSDIHIQVSDSGQGISPELLPYVFDRFRQADSSTRRHLGGLGLGLSIAKHLVELHGGSVQAESAGEGRGSTFTVLLPIRAVRTGKGAEEPESEQFVPTGLPLVRLDGLHVLVVDDEPDARRLLVKVLQQAGAVVTPAASAAEAIEVLPNANPDVLVSDLGMADQDGFDLIRQVRASGHHAKDLPAVALTAFAHKQDRRQALLAGFQMHVPKPADPHDLTAVIASLAGRTGSGG